MLGLDGTVVVYLALFCSARKSQLLDCQSLCFLQQANVFQNVNFLEWNFLREESKFVLMISHFSSVDTFLLFLIESMTWRLFNGPLRCPCSLLTILTILLLWSRKSSIRYTTYCLTHYYSRLLFKLFSQTGKIIY